VGEAATSDSRRKLTTALEAHFARKRSTVLSASCWPESPTARTVSTVGEWRDWRSALPRMSSGIAEDIRVAGTIPTLKKV
jgi:hypothetical protein